MKDKKHLTTTTSLDNELTELKSAWQKPSLSLIGKLREIVLGGGKTGANPDGEGFKSGVG